MIDEIDCIPLADTGFFSPLIKDYLDQAPALQAFYHRFPSLQSLGEQMAERQDFPARHRQVLREVLKEQYQKIPVDERPARVMENIEALGQSGSYTLVTGHQLNIFGGPLFFIYKLASTIQLARQMRQRYSGQHFVPVFWMASEDHDIAEISFAHLADHTLRWQEEASGATGRLDPRSLRALVKELKEFLGPGENARELTALLARAYGEHEHLADATRYWVNALLGDTGLVVLDADDARLKALARPYFAADLKQQTTQRYATRSSERLAEKYHQQAHVRPVNLFYLRDGMRERIEREGAEWQVLNTDIRWDEAALDRELEQHPERFSPNVNLRPLYQEVILPNLAYLGGGGELAYWLQLRDFFQTQEVPFPALVLRNSVLWVSPKWQHRLQGLDLNVRELFASCEAVKSAYAARQAPVDPALLPYRHKLEEMFDELEALAQRTEGSMMGAVRAQRQKQLNGLDKLGQRLVRAEKRQHRELMQRIARLHEALFPGGGLQERHDNFAPYYAAHGRAWLEALTDHLDPLRGCFLVLGPRE